MRGLTFISKELSHHNSVICLELPYIFKKKIQKKDVQAHCGKRIIVIKDFVTSMPKNLELFIMTVQPHFFSYLPRSFGEFVLESSMNAGKEFRLTFCRELSGRKNSNNNNDSNNNNNNNNTGNSAKI